MNDDPLIERALSRLRDAEPAAGFEQKLLVSLRSATEEARRAKRLPQFASWRSRAAFALLVLVAAGATIGGLLVRQQRPEPSALQLEKPLASLAPPANPATAALLVQRLKSRVPARHSVRESFSATHLPPKNTPAPPMALTEQEKLLRRIARQRDGGNLELLNPAEQNTENARATQQFQRFFAMTPEEVRTQFE